MGDVFRSLVALPNKNNVKTRKKFGASNLKHWMNIEGFLGRG